MSGRFTIEVNDKTATKLMMMEAGDPLDRSVEDIASRMVEDRVAHNMSPNEQAAVAMYVAEQVEELFTELESESVEDRD